MDRHHVKNGEKDGKYAWIILLCNFAWYFVVAGTHKSMGVMYVDLKTLFQKGYLATSLVSTIFTAVWCIISSLMGYLVDRISPRKLTFIGGLFAGAAVTSCAFAPSLTFFTVAFGVIGGLAAAMMEPALIATLARYFIKSRLGIANGIAYSGEGLGAMVLPLLITSCTQAYTVRGTMLILGGIWFNCCVIGALLRPPPGVKCQESREKSKPMDEKIHPIHSKREDVIPLEQIGDMTDKNEIQYLSNVSEKSQGSQAENIPGLAQSDRDRKSLHNMNNVYEKHKYIDLLKNTKLLRIIFILFCGGASSYGVTFIFPALALEWGSSRFYSSLILSVAGACEVVSKLALGVVVDANVCNKYFLWTVLFLLAGTGAIVTSLTRSMDMLMIYAVVLGTTGLNFTCLVGPVISDCVPYQALGGAMGLYLLAYGSGISLGYPLIGATRNHFGSYTNVMSIFGGFYIAGALVSLYDVPAVQTLVSRKRRNPSAFSGE